MAKKLRILVEGVPYKIDTCSEMLWYINQFVLPEKDDEKAFNEFKALVHAVFRSNNRERWEQFFKCYKHFDKVLERFGEERVIWLILCAAQAKVKFLTVGTGDIKRPEEEVRQAISDRTRLEHHIIHFLRSFRLNWFTKKNRDKFPRWIAKALYGPNYDTSKNKLETMRQLCLEQFGIKIKKKGDIGGY